MSSFVSHTQCQEKVNLKILSWNCRSVANKTNELIISHDITFLYETWADETTDITVEGYKAWNFYRSYRNPRAKTNSGGVALYVKRTLVSGITIVREPYDTIVWIKLDKEFFRLRSDIYICGVYIWKERSPMAKAITDIGELFDLLDDDIDYYKGIGIVFIVGDFNGRIGSKEDDRPMEKYLKNPSNYRLIPRRTTKDTKKCNRQGQRLHQLCIKHSLIVANGRLGSDRKRGDFTCTNVNGDSIIDYLLIPEAEFSHVKSFDLLDYNGSDHKPISFVIKYPKITIRKKRERVNVETESRKKRKP